MEQTLTREELIELIGITTANINGQFELWLTVTFAVIIASHLAGHRALSFKGFSAFSCRLVHGSINFAFSNAL
jgi:hypothetical protein